ncbi:hypothetical protein C0995_010898 [Termitomyces sp. Mi166|nr:hypothetical protein C0995_010898 [Termitomyces sp. Mi166\
MSLQASCASHRYQYVPPEVALMRILKLALKEITSVTNTARFVTHQHWPPSKCFIVSRQKFYPDRSIRFKKHGSGIWKPAGYATASSQALRLATKNVIRQPIALEYPRPLASITSQMNVIESSTASGSKIQVSSPTTISMLKIQELQDALDALQSGFTLPEYLDFLDKSLVFDSSPLGHLDFTKNNGPVRDQKDALIRLQTDIDSIQTYDNEFVRKSRRKAVHKIGQALCDLEEKVQRRLQEWRGDRMEEACPKKPQPDESSLENPEPLVSEESSTKSFRTFYHQISANRILTTFDSLVESLHHVNGQPIPLTLTPDMCRLVGNDPRFHKAYIEMSSEITKVQMKRIDALSKGQLTDEFDEALMVICRDWEEFVHSLIIVKRNEEKTLHAMLEWKDDSDFGLDPDLDCDTHYLSLVLDPGDKEKLPSTSAVGLPVRN